MRINIPQFGRCDCEESCEKCQGEHAYIGSRHMEVSAWVWLLTIVNLRKSGVPYITNSFGHTYIGEVRL